jgi:lipopolysaccharide heptosyltransferase II
MATGIELEAPRKILVRATNWIGDAVMSAPALEALRERFPEAEIVLLAKPWVAAVYDSHPAVNRQIVYDPAGEHRGLGGFRKLIETLRAERFDLAILFQNAFHAGWLAWCARIPRRIGYARDGRTPLLSEAVEVPPAAAYGHEAYYYLHLLFRAGLIDKPKPAREVRLYLAESERAWAVTRLAELGVGKRFLVGLCPGAAFGPAKRWLPERFAELSDRLMEALGAEVLIFGSQDEKPLAETIAHAMKRPASVLAGQTTLRELMALMAECRLVVSNDSGPMHLATALQVPLVAVFGSTDERATGPLGPRLRVAKHPVECSPCGLRDCPIDFRCMKSLSVDDVYKAALELINPKGN